MTPQFETIRTDSTKMYVFNEYLWDPYLFLTHETQGCAYNLSPAATTVFVKPQQMLVSPSRNKDVVMETIFQIKSGMQTVNKI